MLSYTESNLETELEFRMKAKGTLPYYTERMLLTLEIIEAGHQIESMQEYIKQLELKIESATVADFDKLPSLTRTLAEKRFKLEDKQRNFFRLIDEKQVQNSTTRARANASANTEPQSASIRSHSLIGQSNRQTSCRAT
jgi:hypothetical protein